MVSRIRKSIELGGSDRRVAARMVLGFVAAILSLLLVLAGTSMGLTGAFVSAQPSPSPSGSSPDGPPSSPIFLLNPNPAYDPGVDVREPAETPNTDGGFPPDIPKVSDKFDGVDSAYHIVATVAEVLPGSIVEAYYKQDSTTVPEVTIGQLAPVPGFPDTYELYWEIPDSLAAAYGTITVRYYRQTVQGFEEVGNHSVEVRLQHKQSGTGTSIAAAETVALTWPSQGGPLGFFKGAAAGSSWVTRVDGLTSAPAPGPSPGSPTAKPSAGGSDFVLYYTRTEPGKDPVYVQCGSGGASEGGPGGSLTFSTDCTLQGSHRPSQVTGIAAVALEDQSEGEDQVYSQEAADVHRVTPYLQRVEDMELTLTSQVTSQATSRRHVTTGNSYPCVAYKLKVVDALDRPVQGANVDVHARGPFDGLEFGTDSSSSATTSSRKQAPQERHATESSRNCDNVNAFSGEHGDHNIPAADDIKHVESLEGTGLSGGGGVGAGEWSFRVTSSNAGDTNLTAWIDEEPVADDATKRTLDDDLPETAEVSDTNFVQWLPSAPAVTIDPLGVTGAAGSCQRYVVRVRGGSRAVRGANVDVHATGPTDELDFCDPPDASPRRAPLDGTGHNAEDNGEVAHAGQPPVAQHTEGETNDQGNFIVGITSPVPGDTTLTAWYDSGEPGFDDDERGGSEATGSATTNWVESTGDAAISFVNPSPYGNAGTNVGKKQDVDAAYHVVSRVSSLQPVAGVEFFYRSGEDPLVKIGDGARVGETDAYEVYWSVDVPDGTYTLVARIRDTSIVAEQSVTVRNTGSSTNPTVVPFETVEITSPRNGVRAAFSRSRLAIRGVTSAGAEGVTLYYTKTGPINTPAAGDWTSCGTTTLPSGSEPKEFTLDCTLAGSDQPGMVTGVAALAYNCLQSCSASQTNHSGDAHRVFGVEADPVLSIEPAETAAETGTCQKFVISLQDQTRQPIVGQNLDAHLTGPGSSGNFCAPPDGSGTPRRAPEGGGHIADGDESDEAYHDDGGTRTHHTEGETDGNGRVILGIESQTGGDAQLTVWVDANDDDLADQGETTDVSIMHWESPNSGPCDINGTDGPDELEGTSAAETICGFGGADTIYGRGGDDDIRAGAGRDTVRSDGGSDRVRGGGGRDALFGGSSRDLIWGGGGPDRIHGHKGNDRLRGNSGNDRLVGGSGRDDCRGGKGRDRMRRCERGSRSFAARTTPI